MEVLVDCATEDQVVVRVGCFNSLGVDRVVSVTSVVTVVFVVLLVELDKSPSTEYEKENLIFYLCHKFNIILKVINDI